MAHQVFSLFQVSLKTLIPNKFEFLWQKNIPFSEWDNMPYWEFEEVIKLMNQRNKEDNKRQRESEKQQSNQMPNMNNFNPGSYMPSIPKF